MENLNRKYEFSMNVEQLDSVFSTGAKFSTKDVKTGELHIQLTKSRNIINLNETLCYANILKPDGEVIAHECEVIDAEKGIVKLDLVTDAMNQPGLYNFEIVVTNSEEKLVTPTMQYQCYESLNDGDKIEASNEFGLLEKALIKVDLLRSEFEALYENLERNEGTRVSNESIRTQNENQRQTNESNRVLSEQNRQASFNKMVQDNNSYKDEIKSVINEFKEDINSDFDNYKKGINSDIFDDNKIDFFGKEHDSMKHRLNADFDNLHQRINDSSLLPYEGTNIKADNTYYGLTKEATVKGRTLQNLLTEGMFDGDERGWNVTLNPTDYSFAGGYVTINSKSGSYVNLYSKITNLFKPSTTYTIIFDVKENTLEGREDYKFALTSGNSIFNETISKDVYSTKGVHLIKVTTKDDITESKNLLRSFVYNSVTSGLITFKYMILEGDYTNTPIEELPFVEGIESTGDKSKNLIPSGYSIIDSSYLDSNDAPVTEVESFVIADYIKVDPNKTYTLSAYGVNSTTLRLYGYDINKRRISTKAQQYVSSVSINGCDYIRVSTFKRNIDILQLEEGTQATPYQPYYDGYKVSGKSFGKNLFNFNMADFHPNLIVDKENLTVQPKDESYNDIQFWVYLKKGVSYSISVEGHSFTGANYQILKGMQTSYQEDKLLDCVLTSNGFTFTHEDGWYTIHMVNVKGITRNYLLYAETGDSSYEPYQESTYSYLLDEPLRQLPNGVADGINLETGVLTRRVGKVVLGNYTNIDEYSHPTLLNYPTHIGFALRIFNNTPKYYSGTEANIGFTNRGHVVGLYSLLTAVNNINLTPHENGNLYISILKSELKTLDKNGFKDWLQANPTTVYYELAEPTTEQLTPTQLKSFEGTTHIISENKLMPIVSTKIPSDVNAVVQNLKAENVKLEKQLDSAIEELNNTDIDLIAMDWETDYRLCELEWALLDTMKVKTLAESKAVESRILSRYEQAKILIESGKYNKTTMEKQLTTYHNRGCLTDEEYNELIELMSC